MMRITLVNSRRGIYPPLGLCYLSAYLKKHVPGIQITLIELIPGDTGKRSIKRILETRPDIVGFTTYTVGICEIISICSGLKNASSGLSVWWGGPHITSLPQALPLSVDLGVIGEGEETFRELCAAWLMQGHISCSRLTQIKGVCYRKDNKIHINDAREQIEPLDAVLPPDISLLDLQWYMKPRRFFIMKGNLRGMVLLSSRGCPYACCFCQAARQWGRCRYHTAARVVSEIEGLRRECPQINAINIIDDLFIADRQRLRDIVSLMREKRLHDGIVFNVNGRANLMDAEAMELLKSINVIQVSYGFESGSERILGFLKKDSLGVANNQKAADLTNSYGIGVGGQFMAGTPGETEEDIRMTIDFIKQNKMSHVHLSVTTPLPGTELWEACKQRGLVSEQIDWDKLDFGNPHNPNLLYVNECIPRERFRYLLKLMQKAADRWNVPLTLADYYWKSQAISAREFIVRIIRGLSSLIRK